MNGTSTLHPIYSDVPFDEEPVAAPPSDREPFLVRDAGVGYTIEGRWEGGSGYTEEHWADKDTHPQAPCHIRILAGTSVVDDFHVYLRDFHDAMEHPAMYSERYAEALTTKGD